MIQIETPFGEEPFFIHPEIEKIDGFAAFGIQLVVIGNPPAIDVPVGHQGGITGKWGAWQARLEAPIEANFPVFL